MFGKLKSLLLKSKATKNDNDIFDRYVPTSSVGGISGLVGQICGSYDNTFPNITRIAEAFAEVMPYAIDSKGKRLVHQPRLIEVLYNPNQQMSGSDFFETLIVMMLVHPMVYILCWRDEAGEVKPGGPITPNNISGFTFLEGASITRVGGKTTIYSGSNVYTDADVLTLSLNVNPYNLLAGYSPSQAIKKWATVDDYVADYQAGFFRNGAVPAGEFVVTAPTIEDFDATVDALQKNHRGASKANNVLYVHRPTSSIDGKPMAAQVEWVPFAQPTNKGVLQSIFDQVNKKIDMDFGVPEEVKGYLQNSNYASAEVADYVFARRVVYPKLKKVYAKFTHEMNRVTGGLGYALDFDFEPPVLTDTRKIQAETLQVMLNAGFTVESSVEALQLPRSFLKLEAKSTPAPSASDESQNVTNNDADAPKQTSDKIQSKTVSKALDGDSLDELSDPDIVKLLNLYSQRIIDAATQAVESNVDVKGAVSDYLKSQNANIIRKLVLGNLYKIIVRAEFDAINRYSNELSVSSDAVDASLDIDRSTFASFVLALQNAQSTIEQTTGNDMEIEERIDSIIELVESQLRTMGLYDVIDSASGDGYSEQIDSMLIDYGEQLSGAVEETIEKNSNLDKVAVVALLLALLAERSWRTERWALEEEHRATHLGELLGVEDVADVANLEPYKVWHAKHDGDTCELCIGIDGETVKANEKFSNGDMVPHYHPHCRCMMEIVFKPINEPIKINCPSCGRYMMETTGGVMKNVICANSKCKKHYDFEVHGKKIKAVENKIWTK